MWRRSSLHNPNHDGLVRLRPQRINILLEVVVICTDSSNKKTKVGSIPRKGVLHYWVMSCHISCLRANLTCPGSDQD